MDKFLSSILIRYIFLVGIFFTDISTAFSLVNPLITCSSRFSVKNHPIYSVKLPQSDTPVQSMGVSYNPRYALVSTTTKMFLIDTWSRSIPVQVDIKEPVVTFSFSYDNSKLLVAFKEKVVLWDLRKKLSMDIPITNVRSCDFSYDGKHIALVRSSDYSYDDEKHTALIKSNDNHVYLYSAVSFKEEKTFEILGKDLSIPVPIGLYKVAFQGKNKLLLSIITKALFFPPILANLDIDSEKINVLSKGIDSPLEVFTNFYRDSSYYSVIDELGRIFTFNSKSPRPLSILHHPGIFYPQASDSKTVFVTPDVFLSYSSKGRYLLSGNKDNSIRIFKPSSLELLKTIHTDPSVKAIAYTGEDVFFLVDEAFYNTEYRLYVIKLVDLLSLKEDSVIGNHFFKTVK